MRDEDKTKEQLINDLIEMRRRNAELEKSEAEQKASEEIHKRYELIANTSKELMTLINRNYTYEAVNESYAKAHNKTQEAIIGKTVGDIWGEKVFNRIIKGSLDTCFEGNEVHYQKWFKFSALKPHCFDVAYYPYYSEKGTVTHIVVVTRDISEHKLTEDKTHKPYQFMESIIDNANVWLNVLDEKANVVVWNKEAEKISGYSCEEVIGHNTVWEWLYPDEKCYNEITAKIAAIIEKRQVLENYETTIRRKDGETKTISWNCRHLVDDKSNFVGSILIGRDITDYERMKEELQKSEKLESIGILAGGIAHDFNNLLTGVLGNISLAEIYLEKGGIKEATERLNEAEKAALSSKHLTKRLLTFSEGGYPIKETVFISKVLKGMTELALSGSNVRCEFSIPDDLWPVEIDKGQISQVIQNLVINADQAMPKGGVIRIKAENTVISEEDDLSLRRQEDKSKIYNELATHLAQGQTLEAGKYIKISVEDKGIGIPKEKLSKIFDPYFTTKEMGTQKGTGLGLAICYSIIENHNGYITVESELGVGTTFHIYLPVSQKRILPEKVKEEPIVGVGNILLMDDEEVVREVSIKVLKHIGYEVMAVEDGSDAIELYQKAKELGDAFDVVILDLTVPGGMGGKEAIKRLLEIDPEVKAIVSSGYSNDPIMSNYRQYGFSGVIAKPYNIKELSVLLHKVALAGFE